MRKLMFVLTSIAVLMSGCDDTQDIDYQDVLFDAVEVNARLEDDPSQAFLVDISDGTVNYFDESSEEIDFSNFLFFCPSMPAPLPLEVVAAELLEDRPENWSVQMTDSDGLSFRSKCITICQNGQDCYERCPAKLPEQPEVPPLPEF